MLNQIAARATAAKWALQEKMAREDGLETAEKLVITAIVVVIAIAVFLFIGKQVNTQAVNTGSSITSPTTGYSGP